MHANIRAGHATPTQSKHSEFTRFTYQRWPTGSKCNKIGAASTMEQLFSLQRKKQIISSINHFKLPKTSADFFRLLLFIKPAPTEIKIAVRKKTKRKQRWCHQIFEPNTDNYSAAVIINKFKLGRCCDSMSETYEAKMTPCIHKNTGSIRFKMTLPADEPWTLHVSD